MLPKKSITSFLIASMCSVGLCAESSAALDPELKTPYQVRVVLHVAEHRMLTPEFHKQVESELRDQLRLAFGKLAQVEVVRAHPLLADIRSKGLQRALDTWEELSSIQTHFVFVDYSEGQYQIQTGHHDGMTGLSSGVVGRESLGDRQRVGEAAAELVRQNFGVVGTFQKLNGKEVRLAIKGGGLVDSLGPWVQRGDVFLVVRISEDGGKTRASPIEWAILQAAEAPADGQVRCHYSCRYSNDWDLTEGNGVVGYRCLRLRTTRAPVRVRLVNDETHEFLNNLRVEVYSNADYKGNPAQGTNLRGLFESKSAFANVGYVRVLTGKMPLAAFPIPLVDERTVVVRMAPNIKARDRSEIDVRRDLWESSLLQALNQANLRFAELNATKSLEAQLRLGRQHQQAIAMDSARFAAERVKLVEIANQNAIKVDLSTGDQHAAGLSKKLEQITKYVAELDALVKVENSDETRELKAAVQRADLLEKQAEFDKAIELYESVLKVRESAELKAYVQQLKRTWAVKSPEHGQARQFIYSKWPAFDLTALKANFDEAEKSLQTCKTAGDRMTPLKLQMVNIQHALALTKELDHLNRSPDGEDNRSKIKAMSELGERLRALRNNVAAWIATDKGTPK